MPVKKLSKLHYILYWDTHHIGKHHAPNNYILTSENNEIAIPKNIN